MKAFMVLPVLLMMAFSAQAEERTVTGAELGAYKEAMLVAIEADRRFDIVCRVASEQISVYRKIQNAKSLRIDAHAKSLNFYYEMSESDPKNRGRITVMTTDDTKGIKDIRTVWVRERNENRGTLLEPNIVVVEDVRDICK